MDDEGFPSRRREEEQRGKGGGKKERRRFFWFLSWDQRCGDVEVVPLTVLCLGTAVRPRKKRRFASIIKETLCDFGPSVFVYLVVFID